MTNIEQYDSFRVARLAKHKRFIEINLRLERIRAEEIALEREKDLIRAAVELLDKKLIKIELEGQARYDSE